MALSSSAASGEPRSFSVGPVCMQLINFSVASGDTSGSIKCDRLSSLVFAHVSGVVQTAAPTFSGNTITLAFADPLATVYGQVIAVGRK